MGISIWQIAIILLMIVVPSIAIMRETTELTLARGEFAILSFLFYIVLPVMTNILTKFFTVFGEYAIVPLLAMGLAYIVVWYKYSKRVVRRARHAGIQKKMCYLFAVPLVNLLFVIFLFFKGPSAGHQSAGDEVAS